MKNSKRSFRILAAMLMVVLCLGFNQVAMAAVIFVDEDAVGTNTGTNWTDAFTDLQNGLELP